MPTQTSLAAYDRIQQTSYAQQMFNHLLDCNPTIGITAKEMERLIHSNRSTASSCLSTFVTASVARQMEKVVREDQEAYVLVPGATFDQYTAWKANAKKSRKKVIMQAADDYRKACKAGNHDERMKVLRVFMDAAVMG